MRWRMRPDHLCRAELERQSLGLVGQAVACRQMAPELLARAPCLTNRYPATVGFAYTNTIPRPRSGREVEPLAMAPMFVQAFRSEPIFVAPHLTRIRRAKDPIRLAGGA